MSERLQRWAGGRAGLLALATLAVGQAVVWLWGLPDTGNATTAFAWRAALLAIPYAAAAALSWRRRDRVALSIVIVAAVVFRLAALAWPPDLSSDLYRYLWDGRVQVAGESPYAASPDDPSLAHLRDAEIWPRINRPEVITVYPPGAQVVFMGLARAGAQTPRAIKIAALCAELVALALMVLAVQRRKLSAGHLILYAWSPLVIAEVCVSGHIDALVLPLVIGAILTAERRPTWSGVLIGAGILLKLYPVLLLAAIPPKSRLRVVGAATAVVVLGYLPYALTAGTGVLGFLPDYVRVAEDFNPALRGFLQSGLQPLTSAARQVSVVAAGLGLGLTCAVIARRNSSDPVRAARRITLAFVLLLPTAIHPWYALWLVPFFALEFSGASLWLACALPLSYLKYGAPGDVMPAWVPLAEWLPAVALLAIGWRAIGASRSPALGAA